MVTFTRAASAESASLQRDIGSTSHLPDLCKVHSVLLGAGAWHEAKQRGVAAYGSSGA